MQYRTPMIIRPPFFASLWRRRPVSPVPFRALRESLDDLSEPGKPYVPVFLVNKTGVELVAGDVVAVSDSDAAAVTLEDVAGGVAEFTLRQFVVAVGPVTIDGLGEFAVAGYVANVNAWNAITQGHWVKKSTVTKALVTTSVPATAPPPIGAIGFAGTTKSGAGAGHVDVVLLGRIEGIRAAYQFTNNTGQTTARGAVYAINDGVTTSIERANTASSLRRFVVARHAVSDGGQVMCQTHGYISKVKAQGTVTVGHYVCKSATVEAIEDTGVAMDDTTSTPAGTLGVATSNNGTFDGVNVVDVLWFGQTAQGPAETFDPETTVEVFSDFIAFDPALTTATFHNGTLTWTLVATAAATSDDSQAAGGIIRIVGDAAVTGELMTAGDAAAFSATVATAAMDPTLKMRQAQFGTGAGTRRFGFAEAAFNNADRDGIYFRHAVGGNYIAVCREAGAETTIDTGVAAAAATFHTFSIVVTGDGSGVEFFVDGVSKGSITTNIPAAALGLAANSGTVATTSGLLMDYFHVRADRS